jgi:distribution and morphology protein 12
MSIDLNWETLTSGPDGQELAHRIRDFIHEKFQAVPLPRFIKSVTVHDFEFGSIPPQLELKDITDPLPDFYEINPDEEDDSEDEDGSLGSENPSAEAKDSKWRQDGSRRQHPGALESSSGLGSPGQVPDLGSPFLGVMTPGIPGGTSNLHYFHSQFASGLSGTQTPLAAVASAQHLGNNHGPNASSMAQRLHQQHQQQHNYHQYQLQQHNYGDAAGYGVDSPGPSHSRNPSQSSSISFVDFNPIPIASPNPASGSGGGLVPTYAGLSAHPALREKHSVSTLAPTSAGGTRPPTRDTSALTGSAIDDYDDEDDGDDNGVGDRGVDGSGTRQGVSGGGDAAEQPRFRERRVDDIQAVFRIQYAGDVRLLLTADILLDYPMPSFVGIPVRLSITGLTFDGVGVVANIRKRVHFCFLSPEDAVAAIGDDEGKGQVPPAGQGSGHRSSGGKVGGLLQEIRVESEIGQREGGKQSLKNVGKVERFVLEQVRRIFEDEFVYPSFWTFLV